MHTEASAPSDERTIFYVPAAKAMPATAPTTAPTTGTDLTRSATALIVRAFALLIMGAGLALRRLRAQPLLWPNLQAMGKRIHTAAGTACPPASPSDVLFASGMENGERIDKGGGPISQKIKTVLSSVLGGRRWDTTMSRLSHNIQGGMTR